MSYYMSMTDIRRHNTSKPACIRIPSLEDEEKEYIIRSYRTCKKTCKKRNNFFSRLFSFFKKKQCDQDHEDEVMYLKLDIKRE